MVTLADYIGCSTAGLRKLDLQLIEEINRLVPGMLQDFSHLPISLGRGVHPYLQPSALTALESVIAILPNTRLHCNSAYRSLAQQLVLHNHARNRCCGITTAAVPGLSNHNSGLALDIQNPELWKPHLEKRGWDWLGSWDKWHFDFVGARGRDIRPVSVLAFQRLWNSNCSNSSYHIPEDGLWGRMTHQALLRTPVNGFGHGPVIPAAVQVTQQEQKFPSLRLGMSGYSVRSLQETLTKRGFPVTADGYYGVKTLATVKLFQSSRGLPVDGIAGSLTQKALATDA